MASQSAAAHIMKPVVSISMSPESFSSAVTGADVTLTEFPESFAIFCRAVATIDYGISQGVKMRFQVRIFRHEIDFRSAVMSMSDRDGFIWYDGRLVPWRDANTHVLTHSLHYGLAVFEGVRAYKTEIGTAIFRLKEHTDRLFNSAKIYMMEIPYSKEELIAAQKEVVRANALESCYLR